MNKVKPKEIRKYYDEAKKKSDFSYHMWAYLFIRPLSFYITPLFIWLGFSANGVTILASIPLVVGLLLISLSETFLSVLIGAILINLWYLLDFVDGNIARFKGESSTFGSFLDSFFGTIYHVFLPLSVGLLLTQDFSYGSEFSVQHLSREIWLPLSFLLVLFFCLRKITSQKVQLIRPVQRDKKVEITIWKVLFRSIDSFKAPLLVISIIFTLIDLWLVTYLLYMFISFVAVFLNSVLLLLKSKI